MDTVVQAIVMGIVQGLTEFLPVSSSGHLILVPALFGWDDTFIESLTFSVMLHLGTLVALLAYFWKDWVRLVPAGLAALRDRSFASDPDRRLAWLIAATTVPAIVVGVLLNDFIEENVRLPVTVAVLLLLGAAILWTADRIGRTRSIDRRPYIRKRAGHRRSAGGSALSRCQPVGHIDRGREARRTGSTECCSVQLSDGDADHRGSRGMETLKVIRGGSDVAIEPIALAAGMVAALVSGLLAIHFLLRWLSSHSLNVFVWYRIVLAAIILALVLTGDL